MPAQCFGPLPEAVCSFYPETRHLYRTAAIPPRSEIGSGEIMFRSIFSAFHLFKLKSFLEKSPVNSFCYFPFGTKLA